MVAECSLEKEKSHAALLTTIIRNSVRDSGISLKELEAIAVSSGPGSYTGLRIGLATAKGLCYALGIPLIGLNTLTILGAGYLANNAPEALLCPIIDARRMEVYYMIMDAELQVVAEPSPIIVTQESFLEFLDKGRIIFFGSGSEKCQEIIHHPHALWGGNLLPEARHMGRLAYERFVKGDFEDLAYFEPEYLKEVFITQPKK